MRTDHIGRPDFATTMAGTKVWSASFLPFGGVHVTTGAPIDARFPGQWFQMDSGLHQNWMRDYDPTTGRYIEPDPLGLVDGASIYGYARQNPGRYTDPRGEQVLQLGYSPYIHILDWTIDPNFPAAQGIRYSCDCSDADLVFHIEPPPKKSHWHYHPYGDTVGGRKASSTRWHDPLGDDHLYPPYILEVPDCPHDGSVVDPTAVTGLSLFLLLLMAAAQSSGGGMQTQ